MLLSLILYGSRARGDHRLSSDVDLLGIIEGGMISKEVSSRGASLYKYPFAPLMEKSKEGDLFVLHLCEEGKLLHDTVGTFQNIKDCFEYKKSYRAEIREASALVWYLSERPLALNTRRARKRLVWGLRTLIIATAAEQRTPVFGAKQLEEFSGLIGLKAAIDRRFTVGTPVLAELAAEAVSKYGFSRRSLGFKADQKISARSMEKFGALAASAPRLTKLRRKANVAYE